MRHLRGVGGAPGERWGSAGESAGEAPGERRGEQMFREAKMNTHFAAKACTFFRALGKVRLLFHSADDFFAAETSILVFAYFNHFEVQKAHNLIIPLLFW